MKNFGLISILNINKRYLVMLVYKLDSYLSYKYKYIKFLFKLFFKIKGFSNDYSPNVDATTSNAFISAAFRFGHTLVTSPLTRQTRSWSSQGSSMKLKNKLV